MANTISQIMTNRLATPNVMNPVGESHGRLRSEVAYLVVDESVDTTGHLYRLFTRRAHDSIRSLAIVNDGAATTIVFDVGIWTPSGSSSTDPVTLSKDDILTDGYDAATTVVNWTEILGFGTNAANLATLGSKQLWAMASLTEPIQGTEYEIVAEVQGDVATADEAIAFKIEYVAGD